MLYMIVFAIVLMAVPPAASSEDHYIWMKIETENLIQSEPIRVNLYYVNNDNFELKGKYVYHRSIEKDAKIIARLTEGEGDRGAFQIEPSDLREINTQGQYTWNVEMKKPDSRLSMELNACATGKTPVKLYLYSEDIKIKR